MKHFPQGQLDCTVTVKQSVSFIFTSAAASKLNIPCFSLLGACEALLCQLHTVSLTTCASWFFSVSWELLIGICVTYLKPSVYLPPCGSDQSQCYQPLYVDSQIVWLLLTMSSSLKTYSTLGHAQLCIQIITTLDIESELCLKTQL